jgi:tRNA A37 methylthiotransferase MiaB
VGRTACIAFADGCPRAQFDTALLFDYFTANGWQLTEAVEDADVVVVTTCAVEQRAEDRSLALLAAADDRRRAGSLLIVTGCMAGILEDEVHARFDAAVIPPRDVTLLDQVIGASVKLADVPEPHDILPRIETASSAFKGSDGRNPEVFAQRIRGLLVKSGARRTLAALGWGADSSISGYLEPLEDRYSIRAAWGCLGECTYCAIRAACGPLRSKPLDALLAEFDAGLASGRTHFRLIAQDIGAYGLDIGSSVVELLEGMFARDAIFDLQLIDLNVRWLVRYEDDLVPLIAANASRLQHLATPLQSGSDRVLGLMRRHHTSAEAGRVLTAVRAAAPALPMSTHVMVGFPGETEADLQDTMAALRAIRFDRVNVFDYADRPGTVASSMPDKVPHSVIVSRSRRIRGEFRGRQAALAYWMQANLEALRRPGAKRSVALEQHT